MSISEIRQEIEQKLDQLSLSFLEIVIDFLDNLSEQKSEEAYSGTTKYS